MKSVTIDQSHEVMSKLATNVDWVQLDGDVLQQAVRDPKKLGIEFTKFLKNGGRALMMHTGKLPFIGDFDPVFIGEGWKIITKDCDSRENDLPELDLSQVRFEFCLEGEETYTSGEERLKRLKAMKHTTRLGGRSFKTCWENRALLPESWKKDEQGNTRYVFFDGLILEDPHGRRCSLFLCWGGGRWNGDYYWLDDGRDGGYPSAVLAR